MAAANGYTHQEGRTERISLDSHQVPDEVAGRRLDSSHRTGSADSMSLEEPSRVQFYPLSPHHSREHGTGRIRDPLGEADKCFRCRSGIQAGLTVERCDGGRNPCVTSCPRTPPSPPFPPRLELLCPVMPQQVEAADVRFTVRDTSSGKYQSVTVHAPVKSASMLYRCYERIDEVNDGCAMPIRLACHVSSRLLSARGSLALGG